MLRLLFRLRLVLAPTALLASAALTLVACGPPDLVAGFRDPSWGGESRAAFDLECPSSQLQIVGLGGDTVGVSGCGKRATYKFVWNGVGWVKNSETAKASTAPTAGP